LIHVSVLGKRRLCFYVQEGVFYLHTHTANCVRI
jgi:hypothetical protein